jgi:signal peptidase II
MATKLTAAKLSTAKSSSHNGHLAQLLQWLGLALVVILADQLTKLAIVRTLAYAQPHWVTSFFNLMLLYNQGAAFNFLAAAGGWQRWLLTGLAVLAVVVITYLLKRHSNQGLFCTALSLILGGAIGNLIDRVAYGHVIDFLDFHVAALHWPVFNLADSAITLGAMLLVIDELRRLRRLR